MLKRSTKKTFALGVVHPVGDKIDPDEDPFTSAQCEVLEETGVSVKDMRLEAVLNELLPPLRHDCNWLIFHFTADYEAGEVTATDEGERVWLTADEIKAAELFPSVGIVVDRMLDPAIGTVFAMLAYRGGEIDLKRSVIRTGSR